jgi:hypothetical protein
LIVWPKLNCRPIHLRNIAPIVTGTLSGRTAISAPVRMRSPGASITVLFHPDYTVGLGITPNLLTPLQT